MTLFVLWVDSNNVLGAFQDRRSLSLGNRFYGLIKKALDLSLETLAGHCGGIVRRRGRLVYRPADHGVYSLESPIDSTK